MNLLPTVIVELSETRSFMDALAILGLRREIVYEHKKEDIMY